MKRYILLITCALLCVCSTKAQMDNHVHWSFTLKDKDATVKELVFKANIDKGWHLYDQNMPDDGPVPTEFSFEQVMGAELIGKPRAGSKPSVATSEFFPGIELRSYEGSVTFVQQVRVIDKSKFHINGYVRFMSCDDKSCTPPMNVDFEFTKQQLSTSTLNASEKGEGPATVLPDTKTKTLVDTGITPSDTFPGIKDTLTLVNPVETGDDIDWWAPVTAELQTYENHIGIKDMSWWYLFIAGFIGGLVAFLTPCVWPMVPMTVSFFLKRTKNRKKSIADTLLYAVSIIVIYLLLGLLITAIFGASALNEMSTNAIFNLFFFALLVFFAISFFGAFEITLPASWTNKLDKKADATTGILSIFLMAFTLVLVSFSCTGPIIGTLLVEAASSGSQLAPAVGMFGFALALSIPFALFALFPSWMQNLPKSGGWLNSVKVVLGFLELALALKFLSVADLAYHWRILDREVFLVLWIVIFILLGFYLLGKVKFAHDSDVKYVSVPRLFLAIISFAFALYMVPGLWGAPLKAISAFSPPLYTQDFSLYKGEVLPQFKDYEAGMEYAQKEGKAVLIDFTGYGCVNCRNMEAAVWTDPRVKSIIDNDYVLISLYVDDKQPLPKVIEVEEFGKEYKLRTIGDKWSYLQRSKFGTNAQPYYVLLDNNGKPLGPSRAYDKDIEKYISFLKTGLNEYRKNK